MALDHSRELRLALAAILFSRVKHFGRRSPKEQFCEIILKSGHWPRKCPLKFFLFLALAVIFFSGADI